jgi:hypothetical protein
LQALQYGGDTQASFAHPFTLRITTALCDNLLSQEMTVVNTGL